MDFAQIFVYSFIGVYYYGAGRATRTPTEFKCFVTKFETQIIPNLKFRITHYELRINLLLSFPKKYYIMV